MQIQGGGAERQSFTFFTPLLQKFGIMRRDYEMFVKIVRVTSLDSFQQLWRVGT